MATGRNVCFDSDRFSSESSGGLRPGREFATWIAAELRARGEDPGDVVAEDWGWLIPLQSKPCRVFVGCGIRDGSQTEWVAFAAAEKHGLQLFSRIDPSDRLDEITGKLMAMGNSGAAAKRAWLETEGA
jgi:hypothetical protein